MEVQRVKTAARDQLKTLGVTRESYITEGIEEGEHHGTRFVSRKCLFSIELTKRTPPENQDMTLVTPSRHARNGLTSQAEQEGNILPFISLEKGVPALTVSTPQRSISQTLNLTTEKSPPLPQVPPLRAPHSDVSAQVPLHNAQQASFQQGHSQNPVQVTVSSVQLQHRTRELDAPEISNPDSRILTVEYLTRHGDIGEYGKVRLVGLAEIDILVMVTREKADLYLVVDSEGMVIYGSVGAYFDALPHLPLRVRVIPRPAADRF